MRDEATFRVKAGLAEMLKGGVIMDVVTAEQAKIAEAAGAAAVMALERVPADIRRDGGVARMSDPTMIRGIQEAVTIPVMAKARIGHFAEAQVLEALEVDYVDESEVLTPADEANHIDKWGFKVPFVCGATNLGEALRRIGEGAAMIRSKGEAGTGDIVEAVRHLRAITGELRRLRNLDEAELASAAQGAAARRSSSSAASPRAASCPSCCSAPAGSRRPPTPRWSCSWAPRACSSARGSSSPRSPSAAPGRSSRPRRTSPTPSGSPRACEGLGEAMQRSRRASSTTSSCSPAAAGSGHACRRWSASSPSRATSRPTRAMLRGLGAEPREVRVPAELEGSTGWCIPGGESTMMTLGIEREGLAEPLRGCTRRARRSSARAPG